MPDRIVFGFDNWNFNYNWWNPNTVPPDFCVDGAIIPPATHHQQWFICTESIYMPTNEEILSRPAARREYLSDHPQVEYNLTGAIGGKYIYPVCVKNTQYFTVWEKYGLRWVKPQTVDDIRSGRAKLVFIMQHEGTSGGQYYRDPQILSSWCNEYGLNRDQVYYISANYGMNELCADLPFTHIAINPFTTWIPDRWSDPCQYRPVDNKNIYLHYSRQPRMHRLVTTCELHKNNLLGRGLASLWLPPNHRLVDYITREHGDLRESAIYLDELLPLTLDMDLAENNPAINVNIEHYNRTFLSLIGETLVDPHTVFFSEKIYKPLAVGHPFMLVGGCGQLAQLRKFGYRTFSDWWDESYDQLPHWRDRIRAIMDILYEISLLDVSQLYSIRQSMNDTLRHNQDVFRRERAKSMHPTPEADLFNAINAIWETF